MLVHTFCRHGIQFLQY